MTQMFPTTPPTPRGVRLATLALGLAGFALAVRVVLTSTAWIGTTFPGFLVLRNRVVPSVGLPGWNGSGPDLYQHQVLAMDGLPVTSQEELRAHVAALAPGTPVRYRVRRDGVERDVTVTTQRFTSRDWILLYGAYLMNAAVYLACGLLVWTLRPRSVVARAFLVFGIVWAAFFFTAMDLYGPGSFTHLHVVAEALTGAAVISFVLLFPQPHRFARWRFAGYGVALALFLAYERYFHDPTHFSTVVMLNMLFLGAGGVLLGARLIASYRSSESLLARQRVRIMALGTLLGLALPGAALLLTALAWGEAEMNFVVFTTPLFVAAAAYAIVKHDLFEIDAMVKRGAYYLLLTGSVGAAYVAAVVLFNAFLPSWVTASATFPIVFTLAVLLVFNPLRARLQLLVDGVFFRTRYDGARELARLGAALGDVVARERIVALVTETIQGAIPNQATRVFCADGGGHFRDVAGSAILSPVLCAALEHGRAITAFDAVEQYPSEGVCADVRAALRTLDAEVAVPLELEGKLAGALSVGPKRSGLFYTAGDAEFLRAAAHQTAIALANSAKYDELLELNATLEARVRQRTAELETANGELGRAYRELQTAEVHLVQSEKMAALGRLVAGVAHEINNPVSFIATSVPPLKRRLAQARDLAPADAANVLAEADEIVDVMARGAERTAAIVRDLRTFSRLGESERKPADLHEGLEVSIRLLEARWRNQVTIHREFGALPQVECDPGQINQVFMNLLANACDAAPAGGNIWVTTAADDGVVRVTIRDDGPGVPPEIRDRIFDPFFTTKDVGAGTGLGLAIVQSIVAAHGGRLTVESPAGRGAAFTVSLPTGAARPMAASDRR